MKHTEITVQVFEEYEDIKKKLVDVGFELLEEFEVNDYYFSRFNKEQLNTMGYLDIMNNSIIVRKFFDEAGVIDQKIVFKKKELDSLGNVIWEEKTQTKVYNAEDVVSVLKMAGICLWCKMENHVYTYQKNNFKFDVHCVKDLGVFIECEENDTIKELSCEQKFEYLTQQVKGLNLKIGDNFSCKKVFMMFKLNNK